MRDRLELTDEERFILTLPFDFKYYCKLRETLEARPRPCSFCDLDETINPILKENDDWIVTENAFKNIRPCKVMLLVISKKHWRQLSDITPEAWASFAEIIAWIEKKYDVPGGMLFLRFGDMRLNAGSIMHLHWNLWVPDGTGPLSAPIYKSAEDREIDEERAAEFEKRYLAGERE